MIRRCLFAAALGIWLAPGAAIAQSEADQDACTPDVFKLCQDYIPNEGPIVACLKARGAELSPACHAVMFRPDPVTSSVAVPRKVRHRHAKRHHPRASDVQ